MASARATVAEPRRRRAAPAPAPAHPRTRTTSKPAAASTARPRARGRRRPHGAIAWIAVGGALLAGVVFVNLAVLQLNLRLEKATTLRSQLRAQNATLQSQLSAALASPRIQNLARQDGLVQADPSTIGYIDLGK